MIKLSLPYPPTTNHIYGRNGRLTYLLPIVKSYREMVHGLAMEQLGLYKPMAGRLALRLDLYPPDNIKRDIDNTLKPLLDALQSAALIENDSQFKVLNVHMHDKHEGGLAKVYIEAICDGNQ